MTRRDVETTEMGGPSKRKHLRREHLELVTPAAEWPDDLLTLLGQARAGYLGTGAPTPSPSPEVRAFLEVPAHGRIAADGVSLELDDEPIEPIELAPLTARHGHPARPRLVALGGVAAAVVLVALGLRPALTTASSDVGGTTGTTAASAPEPTVATPAPSTTALAGDRDGPGTVTVPASPTTVAAPAPVPAAPPVTVAPTPAVPSKPAMAVKPARPAARPTASPAKPAAPSPATSVAPTPATTRAPTVAPAKPAIQSARAAVLAYYEAANVRGKCVAKQPSGSTTAKLNAACGPQPAPPANLVQYWGAKDDWSECADPLFAKGWKFSKVEGKCGTKPDRADFDVPPNPYS